MIPLTASRPRAPAPSLGPPHTNSLASQRLDLGDDRTTPTWFATFGLPRLPGGLHAIVAELRGPLLYPRW